MNTKYVIAAIVVIALLIGSVAAYVYLSPAATETVLLNGSGATFPYPLLSSIIDKYGTEVNTNVQVNYQAIGSGGASATSKAKTQTSQAPTHP